MLGLIFIVKFFFLLVSCLLSVAFFTLLERKVLGLIGLRLGPWKVSLGGFLQPIADAGKLINKEFNSLSNFSFIFYYLSSFVMILSSFILFFNLSFSSWSVSLKMGFIIFLILLGLNSLNSILSGWSIFSKFSLLGSLRTVSQLISYEVLLYLCLFFVFFSYYTFDFNRINFFTLNFYFFMFPFLFLVWFLSILAELNRTPYDFSEGESELVSGFNIEFGSSSFTLIFLAEYGNIFFFMVLTSFIFFFNSFLFNMFFFFLVLWIRSVLPRYRFDKLMGLSWKLLLPQMAFFLVFYYISII